MPMIFRSWATFVGASNSTIALIFVGFGLNPSVEMICPKNGNSFAPSCNLDPLTVMPNLSSLSKIWSRCLMCSSTPLPLLKQRISSAYTQHIFHLNPPIAPSMNLDHTAPAFANPNGIARYLYKPPLGETKVVRSLSLSDPIGIWW